MAQTYYTTYRLPRIEHNTVDVINGIGESYELIVSRETEPGVYHDAVIMAVWPSTSAKQAGLWCVADILFGGPVRYETREHAMFILENGRLHHTAAAFSTPSEPLLPGVNDMPTDLARAKALMLDLDADTIIAAIEQMAAANGSSSVHKIFWAAADAYDIVPVISLDPQCQLDDWNESNPDATLTLEQVKEACQFMAEYDWSWQRDAITSELYDELRQRVANPPIPDPLTPPTV